MAQQLALFDYNQLDDNTRVFVQEKTEVIHGLIKKTAEDIIRIGQNLKDVKECLPHGHFKIWLQSEFAMGYDTALNFMQVANKFGDKNGIIPFLPLTVLYALAAPSMPEEIIEMVRTEQIPPTLPAIREARQDLHRPQELQQENLTPQQFLDDIVPGFNNRQHFEYGLSQKQQFDAIDAGIIEIDEEEEEYEDITPDNLPPTWNHVNGVPFNTPLPDGKPVIIPESWKLPPELRGIPEQEIEMDDPLEELPPPIIDEKSHFMQIMSSSETPEWYTPGHIVAYVIDLFGEIDLDPCSNSHETPNVPARTVFTKEDNGLLQTWHGKVYMNPPYGGEIRNWTEKLVHEYEQERVEEAIALIPGRIDTGWFQPMYKYLMCNLKGRLQFVGADYSAPFPSVAVYLGKRRQAFIDTFKTLGPIIERVG